jgi:hypothetical protein
MDGVRPRQAMLLILHVRGRQLFLGFVMLDIEAEDGSPTALELMFDDARAAPSLDDRAWPRFLLRRFSSFSLCFCSSLSILRCFLSFLFSRFSSLRSRLLFFGSGLFSLPPFSFFL